MTVPQKSKITVRISGGVSDEKVLFVKQSDGAVLDVAEKDDAARTRTAGSEIDAVSQTAVPTPPPAPAPNAPARWV